VILGTEAEFAFEPSDDEIRAHLEILDKKKKGEYQKKEVTKEIRE
jgi:hypothetical protein